VRWQAERIPLASGAGWRVGGARHWWPDRHRGRALCPGGGASSECGCGRQGGARTGWDGTKLGHWEDAIGHVSLPWGWVTPAIVPSNRLRSYGCEHRSGAWRTPIANSMPEASARQAATGVARPANEARAVGAADDIARRCGRGAGAREPSTAKRASRARANSTTAGGLAIEPLGAGGHARLCCDPERVIQGAPPGADLGVGATLAVGLSERGRRAAAHVYEQERAPSSRAKRTASWAAAAAAAESSTPTTIGQIPPPPVGADR
jgi:hypothetical protein